MTREERADLERINASANKAASYNPFATFFKDKKREPEPDPVPESGEK